MEVPAGPAEDAKKLTAEDGKLFAVGEGAPATAADTATKRSGRETLPGDIAGRDSLTPADAAVVAAEEIQRKAEADEAKAQEEVKEEVKEEAKPEEEAKKEEEAKPAVEDAKPAVEEAKP